MSDYNPRTSLDDGTERGSTIDPRDLTHITFKVQLSYAYLGDGEPSASVDDIRRAIRNNLPHVVAPDAIRVVRS